MTQPSLYHLGSSLGRTRTGIALWAAVLVSLSISMSGCSRDCPNGWIKRGGDCFRAGSVDGASSTMDGGPLMAGQDAQGQSGATGGVAGSSGRTAVATGTKPDAGSAGTSPVTGTNIAASTAAGSSGSSASAAAGSGASNTPACGNGVVEAGEKCDGNCPVQCPPSQTCSNVQLVGDSKSCSAECLTTAILACTSGDGCCPKDCKYPDDTDCSKSCGDGVIDAPETCEPNSKDKPCPTTCDDSDPCTTDQLVGSAEQCSASCLHAPVTMAIGGDKCCPPNANANSDADCMAQCGNSIREPGEMCDGDCPTSCDDHNACTTDKLMGSAQMCNAMCIHISTATPEVCDGKDNDCNGEIDEGVKNACGGCSSLANSPGTSCSAGEAACKASGTYVCQGLNSTICNAVAKQPTAEVCDGKDNDCNGMIDDGVGDYWYPDCDSDGYPPQVAAMKSCSKPSSANGCAWTNRAPDGSNADCDDRNPQRHPGADYGLPISPENITLPPAGDQAYDLNCNGAQEPIIGEVSTGNLVGGRPEIVPVCDPNTNCIGNQPLCLQGISFSGTPKCGQAYDYQSGCSGMISVYFLCK